MVVQNIYWGPDGSIEWRDGNNMGLQDVSSLTTQQLLNRNGNVMSTRSVQRGPGGGPQMNLATPLRGTPGAVHIVTNAPLALPSAAQKVMRQTATKSVIAILIGNDEEQGRKIRDGKCTTVLDVDLRPTRLLSVANGPAHTPGGLPDVPVAADLPVKRQ